MKHDVIVTIEFSRTIVVEANDPYEAEDIAIEEIKHAHHLIPSNWNIKIKEEKALSSNSYE